MKYKDDVIFAGRLSNEEIRNIYAASLCLTFVPYFEGFGIPPIEAMQCDVPVIAANCTSIPEVVGDAGLMVDPFNINDIANAMKRIYMEPLLRQELIQKGRIQKSVFSWQRTAVLLWEGISRVL